MKTECFNGGSPTPEILLPAECRFLPKGCKTRIKDVLTLKEELKEKRSWANVRSPEELNHLILPKARKIAHKLMYHLRPFKKEGLSWEGALDSAWKEAENVARNLKRLEAWNAILKTVMEDINLPSEEGMRWRFAQAAAWETIGDIPNFKKRKFFLDFIELYRLGARRIRFHEFNGRKMLFVDFPLQLDKRQVAGCLAIGEAQQGERKVRRIHDLTDHCSHSTPFPPPWKIS